MSQTDYFYLHITLNRINTNLWIRDASSVLFNPFSAGTFRHIYTPGDENCGSNS